MTDASTVQQISELIREAGEEHHKAFIETDGADPDWPLWYADYLLEKLRKILDASFTKSELTYLLVLMEKGQALRAPGANWPRFYGQFLVDRYL